MQVERLRRLRTRGLSLRTFLSDHPTTLLDPNALAASQAPFSSLVTNSSSCSRIGSPADRSSEISMMANQPTCLSASSSYEVSPGIFSFPDKITIDPLDLSSSHPQVPGMGFTQRVHSPSLQPQMAKHNFIHHTRARPPSNLPSQYQSGYWSVSP